MKPSVFLAALLTVGGLTAGTGHALPHQLPPHGIAKPAAPKSPLGSAGLVHGPIGGPVNRGPGINGTGMLRKHR
jgi:hypothetical protein